MARWEPGAPDRLLEAAMDLFVDRGYEATTVADIAARAGVTERTFFRHYADKREVLFAGEDEFQRAVLDAVRDAPPDAPLLQVVERALDTVGEVFTAERRPWSRQRQRVVAANPALQERELLKLTRVAAGVAEAFEARGVPSLTARVAGEAVMSVFGTAFTLWVAEGETRDLVELQRETLQELRSLLGG